MYSFYMKTRVYFGEGSLGLLHDIVKTNQYKRALIITGRKSAQKFGYLNKVSEEIQAGDALSFSFSSISPNPRVEEVDKAVEFVKKQRIDLIIGLGGGSVLDAAKAVAAMAFVMGKTEEVLCGQKKLSNYRMPLIQIPTTAGTGSELSMGAILTDSKVPLKSGIRGEVLLADIAIIDPTLTYSLPYVLSMETGFDVLTHAIETYFSKNSSPVTELYSIEAARIIFKYLPRLADDLQDTTARNELAHASYLMGINLANSSTCLPHRLQYPVGAITDTSHPRGLAAIYKAWLYYSKKFNRSRFLKFADDLQYQDDDEAKIEHLYEDLIQLMDKIGLNITLEEVGITKNAIPQLKKMITGSILNDPIAEVENIIDLIYTRSCEER